LEVIILSKKERCVIGAFLFPENRKYMTICTE
jgi:hypothetical protein